jgi:predicted alpha/beta hydrolase family esterase
MTAENHPDYRRWKPWLAKELGCLGDKSIVVAHSLGGAFLLKYLSEEKVPQRFHGIFLIATPFWGGAGWRYEGFERVALTANFEAKLPPETPIFLYHGRDDEIVPFAHLALYAAALPRATVCALDGRGHQLGNDLSEVAADIERLPHRRLFG